MISKRLSEYHVGFYSITVATHNFLFDALFLFFAFFAEYMQYILNSKTLSFTYM